VTNGEPALRDLDPASAALGIRIIDAGRGHCTARLVVTQVMANAHGICHGGVVFTLADSACGVACNFDQPATVAAGAAIEFLTPVRIGDELTATARQCWQEGRGGVYDVAISNQTGQTVAMLRCRARRLRDPRGVAERP